MSWEIDDDLDSVPATSGRRRKKVPKRRQRNTISPGGKRSSFSKALEKMDLPQAADRQIENDWIASHPAMSRLDRSGRKDVKVLVGVSDLTPSHGPAPSLRAVTSLQHWVNNPKKFQENQLAEAREASKRRREDEVAIFQEGEVFDNMSMLDQVMDQYAVNKRKVNEQSVPEGSSSEAP